MAKQFHPHALVIPCPYQGHINPAIHLSLKLASKGFIITFINTQFIHSQITKAHSPSSSEPGPESGLENIFSKACESGLDIRYLTISDGFPLEFDRNMNSLPFLEGLINGFSNHVDKLVGELVKEDCIDPINCLIADTFLVWPSTIAKKYEVLHVSFFTEPALVFALYYHLDLLEENGHSGSHGEDLVKEEKTSLATIDRRLVDAASSELEDNDVVDSEQNINALQVQLLRWPGPSYSFPPYYLKGKGPLSPNKEPLHSKGDKLMTFEPHSVVALARKALLASREAALLAEDSKLLDDSNFPNFLSTNLVDDKLKEQRTVRSTRFTERQSRKRGAPKPIQQVQETNRSGRPDVRRKVNESIDLNDPLRMFLWGPETKQLLTAKEESELIVKIQISMKLQEVKHQLQIQFAREPTSVEWAEAAGITSRELKSQLLSGKSSREKLINANLRMVVHIAKQYQGRGLNLQDLLQEGSMGLMKSVEKFKPQAGCRFPTYAYWWIRQSVRKAIFQHSRTIRLPENVYALLSKVKDAKKECIQQGNRHPTKEDIASCAGMSVERLQNLLSNVRTPLSMQQSVWSDQDTTFQEITADNAIEAPELSVSKQLMRRHIRGLLNVLSPKERKIIRLRFGIGDGKPKSLSEIGTVFGLSKERVRQLETRALYKLKQNLNKHGLDAYSNLLF